MPNPSKTPWVQTFLYHSKQVVAAVVMCQSRHVNLRNGHSDWLQEGSSFHVVTACFQYLTTLHADTSPGPRASFGYFSAIFQHFVVLSNTTEYPACSGNRNDSSLFSFLVHSGNLIKGRLWCPAKLTGEKCYLVLCHMFPGIQMTACVLMYFWWILSQQTSVDLLWFDLSVR